METYYKVGTKEFTDIKKAKDYEVEIKRLEEEQKIKEEERIKRSDEIKELRDKLNKLVKEYNKDYSEGLYFPNESYTFTLKNIDDDIWKNLHKFYK